MKKFIASLLAVCTILSLAACGAKEEKPAETPAETPVEAPAETPAETMVLRLANSHNAEHITSQACQRISSRACFRKLQQAEGW